MKAQRSGGTTVRRRASDLHISESAGGVKRLVQMDNPPFHNLNSPLRESLLIAIANGKGDSMSRAVEILRSERQRMLAEIGELRKGVREIDVALAAILGDDAAGSNQPSSPINEGILAAIQNGRGTPASILAFLQQYRQVDTSKHSVSTRLQKMKADGIIAHDGEKWVLPQNQEGSDAPTSEPSNGSGPVGRERGYPPSAPEGSIPSGSTASQSPHPSRDLDDEIPF